MVGFCHGGNMPASRDDDDEYGDDDDGDDDMFPANVAAVLLPYWQSMLDRDGERCDLSEYLI